MLALCVVAFGGCIKLDTFIEIEKNPFGTPLARNGMFSASETAEIDAFIANSTGFDACIALKGNEVIYAYGDIHIPYNAASVRKSIFSALYGIAEQKGLVDLDATLGELGVDDAVNPLTETEKTATLRNLLTARSGIYLPSLGESEGMKRRKPERGEFLPGTHFYYNNWDFNALPIILERITGKPLGELIYEWLAIPLGMYDFVPSNVTYESGDITEYPQTRVYLSAEDLARFGALYLSDGAWNGEAILTPDYVALSTQAVSTEPADRDLVEHPFMEGYAYLWWIDTDENTFWADGAGGHFCIVDKANDLVVVVRNNTGMSAGSLLFYNAENPYEDNEKGNDVYTLIRSKLN